MKFIFILSHFFFKSRSSSRSSADPHPHSEAGIFSGLELKLGLTNLISNGMNLIGKLGRKTPTAGGGALNSGSGSASTSSSPSSTTSGAYWECRSNKMTSSADQPSSSATSANVSELIEMTSFKTVAEGDMELQSGKGHHFQGMSSFNPIW